MADPEATFRAALATNYEPDVYVCTELPEDLTTLPPKAIRVLGLTGGRNFKLTTPGVSVDCFASGDNARIDARTLALAVDQFIVWQLRGARVDGVLISKIITLSVPAERTYPNPKLRRFGMTYRPTLSDLP